MSDYRVNPREAVYKIIKYQSKLEEMRGGGPKQRDYRDKIRDHTQGLIDAGYSKAQINRMIQKGGKTIDELAEELKAEVDTKCTEVINYKAEAEKSKAEAEKSKAEAAEAYKKGEAEGKNTATNVTQNYKAELDSAHAANSAKVQAVLNGVLEKLGKQCGAAITIPPMPF